jgi:hypothetical protein
MEPENPIETIRIAEQLSDFLNLSMLPIDEAAANYQTSMHVSLDSSARTQIRFFFIPRMVEIGPRITLSKVIWEVPL